MDYGKRDRGAKAKERMPRVRNRGVALRHASPILGETREAQTIILPFDEVAWSQTRIYTYKYFTIEKSLRVGKDKKNSRKIRGQ